ncbi:MAG: lipopolysaccharide biosynthesis protein, partial [Chloroflexia bacterium]|nr:lipopolysaccharide biosynthesis protein [Chloroflexia bacterium]
MAILPYALVSLWLTVVAAVFQGGLDGCQRMDLRAGLVIAGQVLLLALAFWLVPQHGLVGLAWAQIGQAIFLAVIGRILLRYALPTLPRLPRQWRKHVLREMLGYGANLQAATLFMLLVDPVANALMARFGGPAAAGYFAMANQVVLKARSVIVAANQAIVPYIATLSESDSRRVDRPYNENMRVLAFVTMPTFALLFAWAGLFSWLLTGADQPEFVFFLGVVSLAWVVNIFTGPAYFTNMGTGSVGWNTLSHLIMGVLNAGLGWLLGSAYGTQGVLYAYTIAMITASAVLIIVFQHQNRVSWHAGLSREHLGLLVASVSVVAFGWIAPLQLPTNGPAALAAG